MNAHIHTCLLGGADGAIRAHPLQLLLCRERAAEALALLRAHLGACLAERAPAADFTAPVCSDGSSSEQEQRLLSAAAAVTAQLCSATARLLAGTAAVGKSAWALFPSPLFWTAQLAQAVSGSVQQPNKPARGQQEWRAGHLVRIAAAPLAAVVESGCSGGGGDGTTRSVGLALAAAALSQGEDRPALLHALAPSLCATFLGAGAAGEAAGGDCGWQRGAVLAQQLSAACGEAGLGQEAADEFEELAWCERVKLAACAAES